MIQWLRFVIQFNSLPSSSNNHNFQSITNGRTIEKNRSKRYTKNSGTRSLLRSQGSSSMIFRGTSGTLPFNFYPLQHSTGLRKATTLERLDFHEEPSILLVSLAVNHHPAHNDDNDDDWRDIRHTRNTLDEFAWKLTSWKVNKMGIKFRILGPQPEATVSLTPLSASSAFLLPFPSSLPTFPIFRQTTDNKTYWSSPFSDLLRKRKTHLDQFFYNIRTRKKNIFISCFWIFST